MIDLPRDNRRSFFALLVVSALVVTGMSYFGVRLRGYRPNNNAHWSDPGPGMDFTSNSQAYTVGFFTADEDNSGGGVTIELAFRPEFPRHSVFRFLVLVHDGNDGRQLVIGQWQSSLVIMNGDDFSNELRKPKIYLGLDKQQKKTQFIGIVSNAAGTKVFLDGVLIKKNTALILKYPSNGASARMVLGNSLRGEHPWMGTIKGLAFYDRDLSDETLTQHYQRWRLAHDFGEFAADGPRLLYAFDEGHGERVQNKVGDGLDLKVPAWRKVLHKQVLSWPRWEIVERFSGFRDAFINFIGFMPLGFLLMATAGTLEGIGFRWALAATLLVVFMFSLGIEIVQVWIPTRYSSMLDLILNTLGGGSGAVLFGRLKGVRLTQSPQRPHG